MVTNIKQSEKAFQTNVLSALTERLDLRKSDGFRYSILEGFALDACVVVLSSGSVDFRFLEFKVYNGGRIGFGTGQGTGSQVNLLRLPDEFISGLSANVRWCVKDQMTAEETRYAILDCTSINKAARGQIAEGKQNNFNDKLLFSQTLTWEMMIDDLEVFVVGIQ